MKLLCLLFTIFVLVGCQSKAEAIKVVCDSVNQPEVRDATPDMKAVLIARHIESNLSNSEAKEMFKALANASPETKHAIVKKEAESAGITNCALLTAWEPPK